MTPAGSAHRAGADRVRLRRHQAVRLGQCRRPVWRVEQAPALEGFWLVLFLDQRRLVHLHHCLSRSFSTIPVSAALGFWPPGRRDGDRDDFLLARPQEIRPYPAGRSRISEANSSAGKASAPLAGSRSSMFSWRFSGRSGIRAAAARGRCRRSTWICTGSA